MAMVAKLNGAAGSAAPQAEIIERLQAEIAALKELDAEGLRARWRKLLRGPAPSHLSRYLLFRILAYRVQANALSDLDRDSMLYLRKIAQEREQRRKAGTLKQRGSKAPPRVPPVPDRRSLKPGTILVREHEGVLHRVITMEAGYAWNDVTYRSLSEVAQAITGTNWNGPRFFGLRAKRPLADQRQAGSAS
jgi:Protein of unknown function (DUF2924)